ncbi:MAG: hypothetical protein M3N56_06715, partial [Actinomycetota bacterium]|nr:hypothetical protein [Actinomycetota bacterium]
MAGQVRSYADVVVTTLGGARDPALAELLEAADDVDTELAVPVQLDAALARWTAATEALRDRLVSYVLGEVPVGDLPGITPPPWQAPEGVTLDATVGPLGVHVQA